MVQNETIVVNDNAYYESDDEPECELLRMDF